MDLNVEVAGLDGLKKASAEVQKAVLAELKAGMYFSGKKVEETAKKSLTEGGKTGRVYKRGSVTHRASAPGEAPASDTGRLLNSIHVDSQVTVERTALVAEVKAGGADTKYAPMLEFGTSKMQARPFMFPAFENSKKWIQDRLAKAVQRGIAKGSKK